MPVSSRTHDLTPSQRGLIVALAALLASLTWWFSPPVARAADLLSVVSTTTTAVNPSSTTTLGGLKVLGVTGTQYQVTLGTSVGTLTLPQTSGLTLAYGNAWSGSNSVSFSGSLADVNAALAAVQLNVGSNLGQTAAVSITALPTALGFVYSPTNQRFYQYVAPWTAATPGRACRSRRAPGTCSPAR